MIRNVGFTVQADHAGTDTVGYRLKINGSVVQDQPAAAVQSTPPGTVTFPVAAGLDRGTYPVTVAAYNSDGETEADPVSLVITGTAPAAPTNVRFAVI